jgi:hypothetical protein
MTALARSLAKALMLVSMLIATSGCNTPAPDPDEQYRADPT